jgi:hypothetical protein
MEDLTVTIATAPSFQEETSPKKRMNLREKIKLQRRLKNMGIIEVKKPRIVTEMDRKISKFNFPENSAF